MIITCPRCATRYLLEAGVVRPPGRQVRCARCQHMWFQDSGPELPPAPIPVPVEEPPPQMGPVTDRTRMLPAPSAIPYPQPQQPQPLPRFEIPHPVPPPAYGGPSYADRMRPRGGRSSAGIWTLAAVVIALPLLFVFLPEQIVQIWPASASIYEWFGSPVNARGFKIIASHSQELNNSVPVISIKGQIINETNREREVPKIRLAVRDARGRELYHWTVLADQRKLGPKEEGTFAAKLESPPPDAADLEVRFAKSGE